MGENMDYLETTVLIAVSLFTISVMGYILVDVARDVTHAARKEHMQKKARAKVPNNVVPFSRENSQKIRAIK